MEIKQKSQDSTPLTYQNKKAIRDRLKVIFDKCGSVEETAKALVGVSEITISEILKGDRMNIEHCVWLTVGKQVGWKHQHKIKIVDTANSRTLLFYFKAAKENGETFAIVGGAGSGKTTTAMHFSKAEAGRNVYLLQCAEYLNRPTFLKELLKVMGRNAGGKTVYDMMEEIVSVLSTQDQPLIIMDEVDKLRPDVLSFFITLYNRLHGVCGIVWTSTDAIIQKIDRGVKANKIGFNEIYSRIGRRFIELPGIKKNEVEAICALHDITDPEEVSEAWNECESDLRRIDRIVIKKKMKNQKAA